VKNLLKILSLNKQRNPLFNAQILFNSYFRLIRILGKHNSEFNIYVTKDENNLCLFVDENFVNLLRHHELDKTKLIEILLNNRMKIIDSINNNCNDFTMLYNAIIDYESYCILLNYKFEPGTGKYSLLEVPNFFYRYKKYYELADDPRINSFLNNTQTIGSDYMVNLDIDYYKYISEEEDYLLYLVYSYFLSKNCFGVIKLRDKELNKINKIKEFKSINYGTNTREYIEGLELFLFDKQFIFDQLDEIFMLNYTPCSMKDATFKKYWCLGYCYTLSEDNKLRDFIKDLDIPLTKSYLIHGDLHLKNIIYSFTDAKSYLIDFDYIHEGFIEEDYAAIFVDLYFRFNLETAKLFLKNHKYEKNILFVEIILRLFNIQRAVQSFNLKKHLDNWRQIYDYL